MDIPSDDNAACAKTRANDLSVGSGWSNFYDNSADAQHIGLMSMSSVIPAYAAISTSAHPLEVTKSQYNQPEVPSFGKQKYHSGQHPVNGTWVLIDRRRVREVAEAIGFDSTTSDDLNGGNNCVQ